MLPRTGLWAHADFMRLWMAQTLSAYGARITRTALPVIAVTTLGQSEGMVGVLVALQLGPGILVGLLAGGWIDRSSKRRLLIGADLARAAAIVSLTLLWLLGYLSMAHVVGVGIVVGGASALFQITDNTYLPSLIGRRQLAEGNAKLESTEAVAEIAGPASAGYLIAALGAPLAVAIDAVTYVWSAVLLGRIRAVEAPAAARDPAQPRRLGDDLRVGFRVIFEHPMVRSIVLSHMVWSIAGGFFMALYTPYCLRTLGLSESLFGVIIAMGGIGSLAGAFLSRRLVTRFGLGHTLVFASSISLACALFIPLAGSGAVGSSVAVMLGFLALHQLVSDGFAVAFVIQAVTLRQTVLPREVLGRANAAIHVCTSGILPIAALAAGGLAELTSTHVAITTGIVIGLAAPLFLLPLWSVREMPPSVSGELPVSS